jgi:hypothetical protein
METNFDYQEDLSCIYEPVLDIDEGIYWELDIEAYCQEEI